MLFPCPVPRNNLVCLAHWTFPGSSKASKIDPALSCTCQMWLSASTLRMSKGLQGIAMGHPIPMGFGGGERLACRFELIYILFLLANIVPSSKAGPCS